MILTVGGTAQNVQNVVLMSESHVNVITLESKTVIGKTNSVPLCINTLRETGLHDQPRKDVDIFVRFTLYSKE